MGNETNGALCGEAIDWSTSFDADTNESWQNIVKLFQSGSKAVRDISGAYDTDIKVALHFTNPNNANPSWYAGLLADAGVDYDAIGISYYMYWHGTLSNLASEISTIHNTFGKDVFIAETAYPYTSENFDNCGNQVCSYDDFDMNANLYAISEAGQEAALTAILDTVANTEGCTGLFYWEPAWTALPDTYDEGTGWATKWAGDYISYSMSASEGSSFDNQALFDNDGNALSALKFFADYVEGAEKLPVHDYELDDAASTAATCTDDGKNIYVCTVCGDSYTETVTATGHTTEIQNAKDATCTEDGYTGDEVCTVCGETVTAGEKIAAVGHTTEIQNAKAATCTEDGYTGDEVCTVCGETVTAGETISATGHTTEIQNAKAATCTEDGYTGDEVCTVCGETVTAGETIEATGHTTKVQNAKAATCTEDGYTGDTVCTVCSKTIETGKVIAAIGHHYTDTEVVASTYEAEGYTVYTCSNCGSSFRADYTAILVLDGTGNTADTRQLIQGLTAVPEELAQLYTSVEALQTELISRVTVGEGYTKENTAVYDIVLQYVGSGGTWVNATEGNFPLTGITVTLPYPEGTDSSYDFVVVHMFSTTSARLGIKAGDTESPAVTKTEDGLVFTLNGLSPVAISWTRTTAATGNMTSPETGDSNMLALWLGLICVSGLGIAAVIISRRKKNNG